MDRLIRLVSKYTPAVRAFAIGYLAAAAQRMQVLLVGPGMVALDIDTELRELFNSVLGALERLPKIESDKAVLSPLDLSVSTPLLLFSSQVGCNKKILGCCSL
jgi:NCK-associated protein 1